MDTAILDEVHRFWFGPMDGPEAMAAAKAEMWFRQSDATDEAIRREFGDAIAPAAEAPVDLGALSRPQQVGLVVLLDQFPRNIFRRSGEAFAYDSRARDIAGRLLAGGIARYYLAERTFLFMPFLHSEAVADQDRGVMLFAEQAVEAPEAWKQSFRSGLDFATRHRDLIRRFGRFPHRNEALRRRSTPEETAFLRDHGRGF